MVRAQKSFLKLLIIRRVSLLAVVVFGIRIVAEIFLLISAVSRFSFCKEKLLKIHLHLQKSCRSRAPVPPLPASLNILHEVMGQHGTQDVNTIHSSVHLI